MPRPTIPEDGLARLEDVVDDRTKVPVEHLEVAQRLAFVLDELGEADAQVARLRDRVETLEAQVDDLEKQLTDERERGVGGVGGLGGVDGVNLGSGRNGPGGRGP